MLCGSALEKNRQTLNEKYLTALLVTDAPIRLIEDTQKLWLNRVLQCKSSGCIKYQIDERLEELNFYTSMNQSLTQHYFKYQNGGIAQPATQIQVHQLGKDRIKIEGLAYLNPNNRNDRQTLSLLAYTSPDKKNEILDNEHQCKYQFNYQKSLLVVKSAQKGCERFIGTYRLYD
ncbi:hypothetical protein EC844_12664 [Acinetobacter calcoaceticus]|uniref:Uncharacterized protein n=1 Tax=Acinetobacter calcoaceticus TaxID=471 RepID=A0A4R1XIN3_ACICA|nr:hypothetical protein EC844_12664 [Acinetobacter calcoaceticus]